MRRACGYVLLEAVGAMAVLSVGIVGVHEAMQQAVITRAQARDFTTARFMLEELVSELQVRPQLGEGTVSGDYGENFPRFRWEYKVKRIDVPEAQVQMPAEPQPTAVGDLPPPVPKIPVRFMGHIQVTISWTLRGVNYSRSTETLCQPERLVGYEDNENTP